VLVGAGHLTRVVVAGSGGVGSPLGRGGSLPAALSVMAGGDGSAPRLPSHHLPPRYTLETLPRKTPKQRRQLLARRREREEHEARVLQGVLGAPRGGRFWQGMAQRGIDEAAARRRGDAAIAGGHTRESATTLHRHISTAAASGGGGPPHGGRLLRWEVPQELVPYRGRWCVADDAEARRPAPPAAPPPPVSDSPPASWPPAPHASAARFAARSATRWAQLHRHSSLLRLTTPQGGRSPSPRVSPRFLLSPRGFSPRAGLLSPPGLMLSPRLGLTPLVKTRPTASNDVAREVGTNAVALVAAEQ
jgi:hypothetical protein